MTILADRINPSMPFAWRSWMAPLDMGYPRIGKTEHVNLHDEFAAAERNLTFEQFKWLCGGRKTVAEHVFRAGGVGASDVLPSRDDNGQPSVGTYLPGNAGMGAEVGCVIQGVWSRNYEFKKEPWMEREFGPPELIDVVAWDPRKPGRWWLRRGGGFNGPVWLGQYPGCAEPDDQGVVDLHATPLDWLRAGCTGRVLLDAALEHYYDLFRDAKYVRCTDVRLATAIYNGMRQGTRRSYPEILTREKEDIAA